MKTKISLAVIVAMTLFMDVPHFTRLAFSNPSEDKALDELGQTILSQSDRLKGKRIGVFRFTSLEAKETPEGARVSQCLLERLMKNGSLRFVERSELHKIIGEREIEQAGIVDTELANEGAKILPIDLMITGTVAQINNQVHISARVMDAATGELYVAKSAEYAAEGTKNTNESKEAIAIYKSAPDKLDLLNRAFYTLQEMSHKAPLLFLMAVLEEPEMKMLRKDKPRLANAIINRREQIKQENPQVLMRIGKLKKGAEIMKDSYPSRYELIMQRKNEVLRNPLPPRRRRQ